MIRYVFASALLLAVQSAQASTPFDETRALDADAKVSLDNLKGSIDVDTWDRADIRIAGERGEGTESLDIEGDASRISIRIRYPESGWFGGWGGGSAGDSSLRVTVPVGVSLEVNTVSADITVRGVAGSALDIDSVSGDIEVDSGAVEIRIDSVSGEQRVQARSGDVELATVSGDIELEGALDGSVSVEAVSGDLSLTSSRPLRQVQAGVVSGDVVLQLGLQPDGRLSAESMSGDVELVLPGDASAAVKASTFNGNIRSDIGEVRTAEHGPGARLDTEFGGGAARVELETFSGDVTIRKR